MNKEKQIEEMAKFICDLDETCEECQKSYNEKYAKVPCWMRDIAENLYNAGYRKQSEGEWKPIMTMCNRGECAKCGEIGAMRWKYCPNCGAKMKGGE